MVRCALLSLVHMVRALLIADVHHYIEAVRGVGTAAGSADVAGLWCTHRGGGIRLLGAAVQEAHGRDDCARVRPTPDPSSAISWLECRASSCVTGRGGGGWCRRCRLMVVTLVTSLDTRAGCSTGEAGGGV